MIDVVNIQSFAYEEGRGKQTSRSHVGSQPSLCGRKDILKDPKSCLCTWNRKSVNVSRFRA